MRERGVWPEPCRCTDRHTLTQVREAVRWLGSPRVACLVILCALEREVTVGMRFAFDSFECSGSDPCASRWRGRSTGCRRDGVPPLLWDGVLQGRGGATARHAACFGPRRGLQSLSSVPRSRPRIGANGGVAVTPHGKLAQIGTSGGKNLP